MLWRYLMSIGTVVTAGAAQWALVQIVGPMPPFITFYPAIALAALPLMAREVYWLSAVEGLDHGAIARRLGLSVAEVEALLAEAIVGLIVRLDAETP